MEEAENAYQQFISAPITFVFPLRKETAKMLERFDAAPNWKTNYYLGLLYWSKGRTDEAKQLFNACQNQPQNFAFYLTRYNLLHADNNYNGEADLLKAQELNPNEWQCYKALSDYYNEHNNFSEALNRAKKGYEQFRENYVVAYQFAKNLVINRQFDEALKVLTNTTILPNEGASYGRTTYHQACLMGAAGKLQKNKNKAALALISKARQWPENLGVGKPYQTDERVEDYLEMRYWQKNKNEEKAAALKTKIIDFTRNKTNASSSNYLAALLLKKSGNEKEAIKMLAGWQKKEPENLVAKWCSLKLEIKNTEAEKILQEIINENGGTLFNPKNHDTAFALIVEISELN